jgi:transposase InsO family protein
MEEQLYYDIKQYLTNFDIPEEYTEPQKNRIVQVAKHYFLLNDKLYRKNKNNQTQRVILPKQIETILYNLHKDMTGAHLGIDTIYEKAKERYYWPRMYEDIRSFVESCDNCQRRGSSKRREELIPLKIGAPFDKIGIDIKGPLPLTTKRNRYLVVAMDYFTKWPEARAISDAKTETIAKFIFEDIICRHGVPKEILSDRGINFNNALINELYSRYQTKHRLTSSYRPQTNGMVERFNRTIGESLAKLAMDKDKEKDWDDYIHAVLLAYRTKKHETTGFAPFYLVNGRQARLPVELMVDSFSSEEKDIKDALLERTFQIMERLDNDLDKVRLRVNEKQKAQKKRYDEKGISEKLQIGDKVLVEQSHLRKNMSAKLEPHWIGPYYIHNVLEQNVYKLRNMDGRLVKGVIHGNTVVLLYNHRGWDHSKIL